MASKKSVRSVEERLLSSMEDLVDSLKRGETLTYRTVVMQLKPSTYNPQKVVSTRKLLGASQGMFAQFLGTSPATIRAWERGGNDPSPMACRFMDEIRNNPEYWRTRLRESVKLKKAVR